MVAINEMTDSWQSGSSGSDEYICKTDAVAKDDVLFSSDCGWAADDKDHNDSSETAWSVETEEEAAANMARCREMIDCTQRIAELQDRLHELEQQHARYHHVLALRRNAQQAWHALPAQERWTRDTVLTVLKHSPTLPRPDFVCPTSWERNAPATLKLDLDVISAFVQRRPARVPRRPTSLPKSNGGSHYREAAVDESAVPREMVRWLNQSVSAVDHNRSCRAADDAESLNGWTPEEYRRIVHEIVPCALKQWPQSTIPQIPPALFQQHATLYLCSLLQCCHESRYNHLRQALKQEPLPTLLPLVAMQCPAIFNNAPLMLKMWQTPRAICLELMGPTLLGADLKNDAEFAVQVARTAATVPHNALKCFSTRLRGDFDTVQAFVQRDGHNLAHASNGLRRHYKLIRQAALTTPTALRHALPSHAKDALSSDAAFLQGLLKQAVQEGVETLREVLQLCNPNALSGEVNQNTNNNTNTKGRRNNHHHKNGPRASWNLCLYASRAGPDYLPEKYNANVAFWRQAVELSAPMATTDPMPCLPLHRLPSRVQKACPELALQVLHQTAVNFQYFDPHAVITLLDRQAHLLQDERCLVPLALYHKTSGYMDEFLRFCVPRIPTRYWSDKRLMLEMVAVHAPLPIRTMDRDLLLDAEIVQAVFASHGAGGVEFLPEHVQVQHANLVANAIRGKCTDSNEEEEEDAWAMQPLDLFSLYEWLARDLWSNREVALAWLSRGGEYLEDEFPQEWRNDADIFLEIARQGGSDFAFGGDGVLSDLNALKRAVAVNPLVLRHACNGLSTHFDLNLLALGQADTVPGRSVMDQLYPEWSCATSEDFKFLVSFAQQVRRQLAEHLGFVQMLMGIQFAPGDELQCLHKLRVGPETMQALMRLIEEYAGIPVGAELDLLRQASLTLTQHGF